MSYVQLIHRISFLFGIVNTFLLRAHCFCLISALGIYMYFKRIEYHGSSTAEYGTTLSFLLPNLQFSYFLLCTASKKLFLSFSSTFCDYQGDFFKISRQFKSKLHFFLEFQEFSRTKVIFQDYSRSVQTLLTLLPTPVSANFVFAP